MCINHEFIQVNVALRVFKFDDLKSLSLADFQPASLWK